MICDAGLLVRNFLVEKMADVTGDRNVKVPIYVDQFPEDQDAAAVMVFREGGRGEPEITPMEHASVRIWACHKRAAQALKLMANIDKLMHGRDITDLTTEYRLVSSLRNVGPTRLDSEDNLLVRYFCLYEMRFLEMTDG